MTINIDDLREPAELPDWFADREFLDIISDGIESAHQRYRDPKNRAKGPMPTDKAQAWDLVALELAELLEEYEAYYVDDGSNDKTLWEIGDVILTAGNLARVVKGEA